MGYLSLRLKPSDILPMNSKFIDLRALGQCLLGCQLPMLPLTSLVADNPDILVCFILFEMSRRMGEFNDFTDAVTEEVLIRHMNLGRLLSVVKSNNVRRRQL